MPKPPITHNPAFLDDEELARAFVVRHDDLELLLRVIRENTVDSNQHVLVIGPRGIGKTMLVQRVALAVKQDEALHQKWYPLVFAEESYEVATAGEFWLEALFHLGRQTGDLQWSRAYEDLKREPVEDRLHDRALAQLMDFADSQGKRILLIVENLNMLLGEQVNEDNAWKLRHTLMHEPRVMLLATATTRLDTPENTHKAMFELFKSHVLRPLNDDECQAMWRSVAGAELGPRRIRAVSILTGGNPRLLAIISHFGARLSFAELMDDMTRLVDDHTDYFKSHLDALPPTERKTYVALADLWDPSTAREVGAASRLGVSMTSSQLSRLVNRGAVVEAPGKGRTRRYQVAERMYNIYYLMRRRGAPSERVKAIVQFMIQFYEETELVDVAKRLTEEACHLPRKDREYHYYAFEGIVRTAAPDVRSKILQCTPREFLDASDRPESFRQFLAGLGEESCPCLPRRYPSDRVAGLMRQGREALAEGRVEDAERAFREAAAVDPAYPEAWLVLGQSQSREPARRAEAERAFRKATELAPNYACAWDSLGRFLSDDSGRHSEAEVAFRKALEVYPDCSDAWLGLASLFRKQSGREDDIAQAYQEAEQACERRTAQYPTHARSWLELAEIRHRYTHRFAEAEVAYRKAIEFSPRDRSAWNQLAFLLEDRLQRYEEAEAGYREAIKIDPNFVFALGRLGRLLCNRFNRYQEAEALFRRIIELDSEGVDTAWIDLALLYERIGRYGEAEAPYRKATEIDPKDDWAWAKLGSLLGDRLQRYTEAEAAYRKAIELNPDHVCPLVELGNLLEARMQRHEEAEAAFRKAVEIDPKSEYALGSLGRFARDHLRKYEEAEGLFRRIIELRSENADEAWADLVVLTLTGRKQPDRAFELATQATQDIPSDPWLLNSLAWMFYESGPPQYLASAEDWARKAAELEPKPEWTHTLACVLARAHKIDEALELSGRLLDEPEFVRGCIDDMATLFAELAAAGAAAEAFPLLRDSKSATTLEPVSVALQMLLEMETHVAPEIAEVAKDVLKRFDQVRERRIEKRTVE